MSERAGPRGGSLARMALVMAALAGSAAALLGPVTASSGAAPAAQGEDLLRLGRVTYQERCATCHGSGAEGTDQGPPIAGLGAAAYDFYMATGRMPLGQPGVQSRRRAPVLSPEEIAAVTAFLESLQPGGEPIPEVDPEAGDLSAGQQLYQLNCAPCHGATGQGGAAGIVVAPGLDPATDLQVAEAIRIGPGTMPVFESPTVDQNELNAVVRYVAYLRDPEDPGGAGLGGTGPLIEGFVAFFGGVGLMILVVRWIGTRT